MPEILSVGYEGRDLDALISALRIHSVDTVIDVRLTPMSRRRGFSKRALAEALEARGIDYVHDPALGNPRENRSYFHEGKTAVGRRRYFDHLDNGSSGAFGALLSRVRQERVALLCVEAEAGACHRACLSERLAEQLPGLRVIEL